MDKKESLNYTLILHQTRKKLKLTLMEYCIADSIYHLSNNPKNKIQGWCFASKEHMAEFLGTTRATIFDNLNKLIKKGLIERDPDTKYLRTTQKWYDNVVISRIKTEYQKTLHTVKKLDSRLSRNLTTDSKETLHYNNNNNNNNNYNKSSNKVALIRNYFINQCKALKNFEPEMSFGKEGKLLKEKLKRYSVDQLKDLIDAFFDSKVGDDLGFSLSICLSSHTINLWKAGKLNKKKHPYYDDMRIIERGGKKFCIPNDGSSFLEFAGKESDIIWK